MIEFRGAGPAEFDERLDTVIDIYTAAMRPPAEQITGRRSIMRNHGMYPRFQCYFAELRGEPPVPVPVPWPETGPGTGPGPGPDAGPGMGRGAGPARRGAAKVVGFAYGFHGAPGQWWHDVVYRALEDRSGPRVADAWLGDAFELAEIHVHPDYQGKGIGRAMITTLCAGRAERSAVLSTHDRPTAARHLYRSMGFTDLLSRFVFPGGHEEYAIAGRPLPLS
ncbi:GNAT family N-acetyltransferase [Nonomuraea roseoviolacea]|uniref:GNAT superfamily N-acetyltransferase n=1 Tax=Nonomuraea roseoviolacea subsp. carminata TaxID=160689 RepID=A0ABT1JU88_9ACTN|nr:GNAT family N-acetyltransferase [Nonomuraea roseoviolacea]MCP2344374.1 GNAT superfamily N-acetyltransferase [Nonomuraea roseoviolacea subsp. carminata]